MDEFEMFRARAYGGRVENHKGGDLGLQVGGGGGGTERLGGGDDEVPVEGGQVSRSNRTGGIGRRRSCRQPGDIQLGTGALEGSGGGGRGEKGDGRLTEAEATAQRRKDKLNSQVRRRND